MGWQEIRCCILNQIEQKEQKVNVCIAYFCFRATVKEAHWLIQNLYCSYSALHFIVDEK